MRYRPRSPAAQLRRRLRTHNLHALGYSLASLLTAFLLWAAAYLVSYWLVLFALSIVYGADASMPPAFAYGFSIIAVGLLIAAWFDRRLHPIERLADKKPPLKIALDFVYALPRVTFAIADNLSAWLTLSDAELHQAALLLASVRKQRKLPLHHLPVEIPDPRLRDKVILALLLLQLLELRPDKDTPYLRLPQPPPYPELSR